MVRSIILAAAANQRVEHFISAAPITRAIVRRFIAGSDTAAAVRAAQALHIDGLNTSIDYLGEDVTDAASADATCEAYLDLLRALSETEASRFAEVSVKLTALGLRFDLERAAANLARICAAAEAAGTTVTVDAEDHTTTDATLETVVRLRKDFPSTGAVIQSYLRRSEADCRDLAGPGSRVRLCKGAYAEPESVAYQEHHHVDLSYVRCLNTLLAGSGHPMIATHDQRLINIAIERAYHYRRDYDSFEFQMLLGMRPTARRRLLDAGHHVRVYVPYGTRWYGYMMRRLAERPANLAFFLKSLAKRG